MRVVSGELGGRRLVAPDGDAVRPTTDRVREAIFNALGSLDVIRGALVVDAFAGSGALGIEALSRGAEHCTFVERDRAALRALRENLDELDLGDRSRIVTGDAVGALGRFDADVVLADPPYDFDDWSALLDGVRAEILVAESDREIDPPDGWERLRARRYGRTWVTFLRREIDGDQTD